MRNSEVLSPACKPPLFLFPFSFFRKGCILYSSDVNAPRHLNVHHPYNSHMGWSMVRVDTLVVLKQIPNYLNTTTTWVHMPPRKSCMWANHCQMGLPAPSRLGPLYFHSTTSAHVVHCDALNSCTIQSCPTWPCLWRLFLYPCPPRDSAYSVIRRKLRSSFP